MKQLLIEVHYLRTKASDSDDSDSEDDHEDILLRDRQVLNLMMSN